MRTVEDGTGRRYLVLAESSDSTRVRDLETGTISHVENDRLRPVAGESPLETAARAVPAPVRRVLAATPNDRALGLLVTLHDRGPLPARALLDETDRCESDLNGLLAEFRAAGLVEAVDAAGEPGYALTERGREGIATLLSDRES